MDTRANRSRATPKRHKGSFGGIRNVLKLDGSGGCTILQINQQMHELDTQMSDFNAV